MLRFEGLIRFSRVKQALNTPLNLSITCVYLPLLYYCIVRTLTIAPIINWPLIFFRKLMGSFQSTFCRMCSEGSCFHLHLDQCNASAPELPSDFIFRKDSSSLFSVENGESNGSAVNDNT